jgi:hypothetical protein
MKLDIDPGAVKSAIASIRATDGRGSPLPVSESPTPENTATPVSESPGGVELTKKGEAYCASNASLPDIDLFELFGEEPKTVSDLPALAEARGVFFLTLNRRDRSSIATTIERLIDMLDALDGDENLEETGDVEPYLGWPECGPQRLMEPGRYPIGPMNDDREGEALWTDAGPQYELEEDRSDDEMTFGWAESQSLSGKLAAGFYGDQDECEEENEHGGDICDHPHDDDEKEPFLGWPETSSQGHDEWERNPVSVRGVDPTGEEAIPLRAIPLDFRGEGYWQARQALRSVKHRVKPTTYGEIAHRMPDGTIMRTFVESTDSRALSRT